jgi:hypothetical protein
LIIAAISVWIVFCLRDYCLLAVPSGSRARLEFYAASVLGTAFLIDVLISARGAGWVRAISLSPAVLVTGLAFHALVAVCCGWLYSDARNRLSWMISLVPSPAAWILLIAVSTRLNADRTIASVVLAVAGISFIAVSGAVCLTGRHFETPQGPPSDESGFPVSFARWSNFMACCLVPLLSQSAW